MFLLQTLIIVPVCPASTMQHVLTRSTDFSAIAHRGLVEQLAKQVRTITYKLKNIKGKLTDLLKMHKKRKSIEKL